MPRGAFRPEASVGEPRPLGPALARRLRSTGSMRTSPRLLTSYSDFAADLVAEGILSDPWVDGAPRFRMTPIAIDRATQRELYAAAEGVASVHAEAASLCAHDPSLVDPLLRSASELRAHVADERSALARDRPRRRLPDRRGPASLRAQLRYAERRARGGGAQSRRRRRRRLGLRRPELSPRRPRLRDGARGRAGRGLR